MAFAAFFLASHGQAKDWDKERAQYLTDVQISNLRGPVRSLTVLTYTDGSLTDSVKSEFDHDGNLVRYSEIGTDLKCFEEIYTHDASGNRLSESASFGQPKPGHLECQNQKPWQKSTYAYVFDTQGRPISRKNRIQTQGSDPAETTTAYSYDSAGRLVRLDCSYDTVSCFYEYSYTSEPRGTLVRKHSYYSTGNITFDVTRDLLYAADGRLLEVTQTPPSVWSFEGSAVEVYDNKGRLSQEKGEGFTTNYDHYDKYGNWTVKRVNSIREVRVLTFY